MNSKQEEFLTLKFGEGRLRSKCGFQSHSKDRLNLPQLNFYCLAFTLHRRQIV